MFSSNHDAIRCSLQDLPNTVIEAERVAVKGAIDLTSIEPRSMEVWRIKINPQNCCSGEIIKC